MKQVLLITGQKQGGMVHYSSQLANALSKKMEVTQIIGRGVDHNLYSSEVNLIELDFPYTYSELGISLLRTLNKIRKEIKKERYDVVHLTVRNPMLVPLSFYFYKKPFIFTIHDVYSHKGEFRIEGELTDRLLVLLSDNVIVHGNYNYNQFIKKYGDKPTVNKINHGDYSFIEKKYSNNMLSFENEILFFGRIHPYKGLDILIKAHDLIKKENKEYDLTIAGKGKIDTNIKNKIEDDPQITLINKYVSNSKAAELFSRCRCVVLPYIDASQTGIAPIAYSFKKPVIATSVGGLPEVVIDGETGYIVNPEDPQSLADRCIALLSDKTLAKNLGKNGDEFRKHHMSWSKVASDVVNIYNKARQ